MIKILLFTGLAFITMLLSTGLKAQQAEINGIVSDATSNEKLPGVSIVVDDSLGTVSDTAGLYLYGLSAGRHTIKFRYVGYKSKEITITIYAGEKRQLNIALESASEQLGTVVVSASKFEQKLNEVVVSMEVLKARDLEVANRVDMEEAIDRVPGVTVIDGQANIRGGSGFSYGAGSRVMVLVDDFPLLAADANDVKWTFIPIESTQQIEIIKGASSALFGSSAMNGIINLRTTYAKQEPETKVTLFSGFYDNPSDSRKKWWSNSELLYQGGLTFNHSRKAGQFDIVVGGQAFRDDGYRMGEDETRARLNFSSRYRFKKTEGLSIGISANLQQSEGALMLIWQNDTTGALIPSGSGTDNNTLSDYTTTRLYVDPFISYFGKKGASHKLRYRNFFTNNKNNTNQESKADANTIDYQFQKKFSEAITFTSGATYIFNKVRSELYNNHESDNMALYMQADGHFGKLNASLGGRIERNTVENFEGNLVPVFRAGINYGIAKATNIRSSFGQGYRFPSIAEMFIKTNVGDIYIYPNDTLKPESGWTFELGIQQGFSIGGFKGYADVALFRQRYTDMMEFTFGQYGQPSDPLFGLGFKSLNIGNTQIDGVDFTVAGQGNIGSTRWTLLAGYTFIDPVKTDFEYSDTLNATANFNVLKYRFIHTFKCNVEIGWKKLNAGTAVRYFSFMENIDKPFEVFIPGVKTWREQHNDGDWMFDTYFRYDINKTMNASFIVKNMTNHEWADRPANMQPVRLYTIQFALNL